jgi:hypothetical protein
MWGDIIVAHRLRDRVMVLYVRKVSFSLCHSGALSTIRVLDNFPEHGCMSMHLLGTIRFVLPKNI